MGCGGSKQARDSEKQSPPKPSRQTKKPTTASYPGSQDHLLSRKNSAAGSGGRQSSSRQTSTSSRQTSSRQTSSRQGTSSRKGRAPLAQVEEEPADEEIKDDIRTLVSFIDQHVHNFYRLNDKVNGVPLVSFARREIGMKITNGIIVGKEDGGNVSKDLVSSLQQYVKDPTNQDWKSNLGRLCKAAERLSAKIGRHPSRWDFGSWNNNAIKFPSVMRDGKTVIDAQLK